MRLDLVDVFGYREAISDVNEFESYAYWFDDFKREQNGEKGSSSARDDYSPVERSDNRPRLVKQAEKNQKIVNNAMESADNYLAFFRSRGYKQELGVRKPKY